MAESRKVLYSVKVITEKFNRMLGEFADINPQIEFRDIVRAIAIRVVANALDRTRAASVSKIRDNYAKAQFTTMDGKLYKLSNYFHNDALWARIVAFRQANLQTKLKARGLAKKSWLHLGEKLGGQLDVPQYVRAANYKGAEFPGDVSFTERGSDRDYSIKIVNNSPLVNAGDMPNALRLAMAGETGYFYQNLSHGAFATFAKRAAKYPGIYLNETPLATHELAAAI